jgi:ATP-dependent protease HslVU (ClpYQ) peptidase subunit
MTIVVGYLDNDGIAHIASDGMGSNGYNNMDTSNQKIQVTKDKNLLIGYAGRFGNFELQYYSYLPEPTYEENDNGGYDLVLPKVDEEYFFTEFRYKLREKVMKMRFLDLDKNKKSQDKAKDTGDEISLIVAHNDILYQVQWGYELLPVSKGEFVSIGSGTYHAEASINTFRRLKEKDLSPKEMVIEAVKSATDSVVSVGKGIYYANTKDYKVERIEE